MIDPPIESLTEDTFFQGRVLIRQPKSGYRFSLDAPILAFHARPKSGETVVDLGTGCGVVSLLMAWREKNIRVVGVEIQKELAALAEANVAANGMEDRITILHTDIRALSERDLRFPVDRVVSNPPYRRISSGRLNPNSQRAVARHEVSITLSELLHTVKRILKTGGSFFVIYLAERLPDLFGHLEKEGLQPKILRALHSNKSSPAKICLVEAVKGAQPGIQIDPPLFIYDSAGVYSREIQEMLSP
jgi:tRNA1Val (adenine37-N6)-methyltransferase